MELKFGVRQRCFPPGKGLRAEVCGGRSAWPAGRPSRAGRALSKIKNKTLVLSGSDRIRTPSYSRGVFLPSFCSSKLFFFFIEDEIFMTRKKKNARREFLKNFMGRKNIGKPKENQ